MKALRSIWLLSLISISIVVWLSMWNRTGGQAGNVFIENTYLRIEVQPRDGHYIILRQADPNPVPIAQMASSFAMMRIADEDILEEENGQREPIDLILEGGRSEQRVQWNIVGPPTAVDENTIRTVWAMEIPEPRDQDEEVDPEPLDVFIQRDLILARDTVLIEYTVTNVDNRTHLLGFAIVVDTNAAGLGAGFNVGPFLIPGFPPIVNEREFGLGTQIPPFYLQVPSLDATDLSTRGTAIGGDVSPSPNRLVMALRENFVNQRFDIRTSRFLSLETQNGAVGAIWNPVLFSVNGTRVYRTYYGLNLSSGVDLRRPYVLSVTAPPRLDLIIGDNPFTPEVEASYLSPNPFMVEASIYNFGNSPLSGARFLLQLPEGMALEPGIPNLQVMDTNIGAAEEKAVNWLVRVTQPTVGLRDIIVSSRTTPGGDRLARATINLPGRVEVNVGESLPPHFLAEGFHVMLSFPFQFALSDPATVLGLPADAIRLAHYDPRIGDYRFFPEDPQVHRLQAGLGYWLFFDAPRTLQVQQAAKPGFITDTINIPLLRGWNQVGNPYLHSIFLGGLRFSTGAVTMSYEEAVSQRIIRGNIFFWNQRTQKYDPPSFGGSTLIPPWNAFWILANQDATLILSPPQFVGAIQTRQANIPSLSSPLPPRERGAGVRVTGGWQLRLSASSGGMEDGSIIFGVATNACDGLDDLDVEKPPAPSPSPSITLRLLNPQVTLGRGLLPLTADFRRLRAGRQVWEFEVVCDFPNQPNQNQDVTLSWEGMESLPRSVRPLLIDMEANRTVYMRTTSSYTYRSDPHPFNPPHRGRVKGGVRPFQVVVDPTSVAPLRVTGLKAIPNRGRGVTFTFSLSHDAQVDCIIRTLTGQALRRLTRTQPMGRGPNAVVWDGHDDSGKPAPPGTYLIIVSPTTSSLQRGSYTLVFRW